MLSFSSFFSCSVQSTKCTLKQRKFKKFNYLKYKPANDKTRQLNKKMIQKSSSKLFYGNALKQYNNQKPPSDNTTDQTSKRPTLQQKLKSFSSKHTRKDRSRSPSREQSTTKSNNQPRNQKIEKLKAEIEKLKQIKQVTTTRNILIKMHKKIQTERKVPDSFFFFFW